MGWQLVKTEAVLNVALMAGTGLIAFLIYRKAAGAADALGDWASDGISATNSAIADVVVGAGSLFGIPATNQDQCTIDLERGDTWAASFSCPASRFINGVLIDRQNPQLPAINSGGGGIFNGTGASGAW